MQDVDLHAQLTGCVSIILDRRIKNPYLRIEFVEFMFHLVPQKKVNKHQERENQMHKNDFFTNSALKRHLLHALIVVYVDSEKTSYYEKFKYKYFSAGLMEYIWSDAQYR
jgi:hypothetical protein